MKKRLLWVGVGVGVGVEVGFDFSKPESESESESLKFGRLSSPIFNIELIHVMLKSIASQYRKQFLLESSINRLFVNWVIC